MPKADFHASLLAFIHESRQRWLDELFDWLRIPSVSARPEHQPDMLRAAEWLAFQLRYIGCTGVELLPTAGHPVVFGELITDAALPTVLVYGHYDVQPPDPLELWTTPPFEPTLGQLKGVEKIFARGACDDKGQVYMHVKAIEALQQLGPLPCNVKFFIEGEEEIGSASLAAALEQYKHKLAADVLLISDTSIVADDVPSLTASLRGLAYLEVEVTGPNRDLHSGVYGGAIDNPLNVLCQMIASLRDEHYHITIPGFYDRVKALTPKEKEGLAAIPFSQMDYQRDLAIGGTRGEAGYSVLELTTARPTLDVNGIWGGYTGEGSKTVLPAKAHAKISMRLVADQDPDEITALFTNHFKSIAPPTVKVKVTPHHGGAPFASDLDSAGYRAAEAAMTQSFGRAPIPARGGGSIPILALFKQVLGTPTVLMGFGLDSDALHSPNENYGTFNYFKGIETIALFHQQFGGAKTID
jgi:acetylornithine deacetylase/succinyl-diaminopimelate desuccinylase-like protein